MKKVIFILILFFHFSFSATGYLLKIESIIGPVTYYRVKNTLSLAKKNNMDFVLITIDTPGGLLSSTRKIVKEILASKVPVIGYVYPSGSQCASAGTFIALSCHILAMSPITNIGACHPVTLTGDKEGDKIMIEKVVNDTVSFIKTIAKNRKRNEKWAERAVRDSISSTEEEALKENVIDLIAKNIDELLEKIDGKVVIIEDKEIKLNTKNAKIKEIKEEFKDKILDFISDPLIAYLLLTIGMWGIIFEFLHPGYAIPGIVGTIALILGLFGLHTLSINMAGLILIVLSIIFFIIEAITPTFGIFITAGVLTFILGSLMLFKSISEFKIRIPLIIISNFLTAIFGYLIVWFAWRTRKRKVTTGKEGIIGEEGKVLEDLNPEGMVFVHGEYWKAKSRSGVIEKNKKVRVVDVKGLVLIVEEIKDEEK